jgi:hypothetical protein
MRNGSSWSPFTSPRGDSLPFRDGEQDGPRIGPRLFRELETPGSGFAFLQYRLTGVTQDATGAVLGACTVNLFDTLTNVLLQTVVSDGLGAYAFTIGTGTQQCYIVAYKATAPDVYGTTVNSLVGT